MSAVEPVKAAEWYLSQGFRAFPVWGVTATGACQCPKGAGCENAGKHPATVRGFKDATDDIERVRTFLSNPGTSNYGLVLPPGCIAVDVDGDEDKRRWDSLQRQYGALPVTLTQVTANGFHFIFKVDDPIPHGKLFGFVVRSLDTGYIIGAGSHHASGVTYGMVNGKSGIQPLPPSWLQGWERKPPPSLTNGESNPVITVAGPVEPETIGEGHRHDYLRDRGRYYFGLGLRGPELFAVVDSYNQRFPMPKDRESVERAIDEEGLLAKFETDRVRALPPTPEQVKAKAVVLQQALPEVINGALATMPADMNDWLVTDLLRPRSLAVLASTEGVGKSNMRLELGIRVACGHGSLFDTYPVSQPGGVLVFDEENGEREEWQREEAMLASLGLERSLHLPLYNRVSYAGLSLEDPAHRVMFDSMLAEYEPSLVILDTAGSMVEEHGRDFKGVIAFLKSMKEQHACAILLIVHLVKPPRDGKTAGKAQERAITDVMGQWTRAADVAMLVSETEDDSVVLFRVRKRVPRSDITLKRDDPTCPDRWLRVDAKRMPPTVIAKEEHQNILLAVGAGRGTWTTVTGWLAGQGLPTPSRATMMRHLAAMAEAGLIERDPTGVISLTPTGSALLPPRVSVAESQSQPHPLKGESESGGTGHVRLA